MNFYDMMGSAPFQSKNLSNAIIAQKERLECTDVKIADTAKSCTAMIALFLGTMTLNCTGLRYVSSPLSE